MAVARQIIGIGGAHHADQELVAHRPAVDEQILPERVGAGERRQRRIALDRKPVASAAHLHRVGAELGAENVGEARELPGRAGECRRPAHRSALLAREGERHIRSAHGQATYHVADRFAFAAVALEKLEARRRRVEQVAHLDARAAAESAGLELRFLACVDRDRPGVRLSGVPRGDGETRDRADRGQGLAAKAERADIEQVVVRQLRGGVALDREREIVARHAGAVIADADQPAAAAVGQNLDARRAGIERVLDQFLHDACRPLHHLARGDAVDDAFGELADGHLRYLGGESALCGRVSVSGPGCLAKPAARLRSLPIATPPLPWRARSRPAATCRCVPEFLIDLLDPTPEPAWPAASP